MENFNLLSQTSNIYSHINFISIFHILIKYKYFALSFTIYCKVKNEKDVIN